MARKTQERPISVDSLKRYSIGLLLAGMGLIAGSCVPLVQTIASGVDSTPVRTLNLQPGGGIAVLALDEPLTSVPLILVEPGAGPVRLPPGAIEYSLSITGTSGRVLMREAGEAALGSSTGGSVGGRPGALELRFHEITIPRGRWTVRFEAGPAGSIAAAELRLRSASPGLIPGLMTALVLAILGWLAASLGALHWIRTEARRPVAGNGGGDGRAGQERVWTVGCHLSALLGYLLPFGHLIGPSAIWFLKRHALPGVEQAGREVLNFQLSATLYMLAGLFLSFFLIGLVVLFLVVVFHFSMVLYGSLRAQRGAEVRYPFTIRFI